LSEQLPKSFAGTNGLKSFGRPWRRRGIVVIVSAYRTEDPGFESRQCVRFLGINTLHCCCHNLIRIVIVCTYLRKIIALKKIRPKVHREYTTYVCMYVCMYV
jgi:hypothetical protein